MHRFATLCLLTLISTSTCLYGREAVESPQDVNAPPPAPHASKAVASPAHNTAVAPAGQHTSNAVVPYQGSGAVVPYRQHQQVTVIIKLPKKAKTLKRRISSQSAKNALDVIRRAQTAWNLGGKNEFIVFWNTKCKVLTKKNKAGWTSDKRKLVKAHATEFHKNTEYERFVSTLPLKGEAMLVSKNALQPRRAAGGAAALAAIDPGVSGGHKGPGAGGNMQPEAPHSISNTEVERYAAELRSIKSDEQFCENLKPLGGELERKIAAKDLGLRRRIMACRSPSQGS